MIDLQVYDKVEITTAKGSSIFHVPEVLNVHMNEIYKILTTIKSSKFKF